MKDDKEFDEGEVKVIDNEDGSQTYYVEREPHKGPIKVKNPPVPVGANQIIVPRDLVKQLEERMQFQMLEELDITTSTKH